MTQEDTSVVARPLHSRGFSMIELVMILLISIVVTAFAVPAIGSQLNQYRLKSAVASATWAIQSIRFQALQEGYPFQVTFQGDASGNNPTYQVASKPTGTSSFANVGSSVPLSGSVINITAATVIQFQPNGAVTVTQGGSSATSMQLSFSGFSRTITISNYGNLTITSP